MRFREAVLADIPQMQVVRLAVKENVLSNPALVTVADYEAHLTKYGKGWVGETDDRIVAFAIVNVEAHNVWALFVHPDYEGNGIGKQLHQLMLSWYFTQSTAILWLSTAFRTRAEAFYQMQGWAQAGLHGSKEVRYEMTQEQWKRLQGF